MKTWRYNILLTFFLMTSCKEVRKSIDETLHPAPQKEQGTAINNTSTSSVTFSSSTVVSSSSEAFSKSIFENAATLDSIQQALYNLPHLKGKKLFFLAGFYFYDYQGGMISIDLQDPDNPANVDTYTYSNGEWEIKKPVKMAGNQHFPLEMLLMPLDEVKFSTAKKVYDIAVERSKTWEGAEPIQFVYFNQMKAVHVKEWYVMIKTPRRDYQVTFDVNGNLRTVK